MTATEFETAPTSASDDADAGESSRARRRRRSPWGLRRRILFSFTFGSTFLALLLALTTYGLARSNVVQQREGTSIDTSRRNAQTVQASLRGPATDVQPAVDALEAFGVQRAVVWYGGQWSPGSGRYRETALPQSLVDRVIEDAVPARMIVEVDGEPRGFTPAVITDVPIGARKVRVSLAGYRPVEVEVDIQHDQQALLDALRLVPLREVSAASRAVEAAEDAPASISIISSVTHGSEPR